MAIAEILIFRIFSFLNSIFSLPLHLDSRSTPLTLTLKFRQLLSRCFTQDPSEPLKVATALDAEDQDDSRTGLKKKKQTFKGKTVWLIKY